LNNECTKIKKIAAHSQYIYYRNTHERSFVATIIKSPLHI
jgi:hypothetical protein